MFQQTEMEHFAVLPWPKVPLTPYAGFKEVQVSLILELIQFPFIISTVDVPGTMKGKKLG